MENKLSPHCIQRCGLKELKKDEKNGNMDTYFRFDYMGSAEFEFGALPKSLKRIRENVSHYYTILLPIFTTQKEQVFVMCKKEQLPGATEFIKVNIAEKYPEKYHLKEILDFYQNFIKHVKPYNSYFKTTLWWDIDDDWFFGFGEETKNKLEIALKNKG